MRKRVRRACSTSLPGVVKIRNRKLFGRAFSSSGGNASRSHPIRSLNKPQSRYIEHLLFHTPATNNQPPRTNNQPPATRSR
jgi:hypothetical protein